VKPNTQYLLSGSIKGNGLDASAAIHLHTHRGDGSLTESPYASTGPHIAGTQDWTETRLVFTTPPDCAYVTLHLTMNCHGTLWHDALTLIESGQGVPGEILTRDAPDRLHAWRVNPLIKTFPHDVRPPDAPTGAVVYAARNTRQTVQLALRSPREDLVRVAASPLTGPEGAVLAAPPAGLLPAPARAPGHGRLARSLARCARAGGRARAPRGQPDHRTLVRARGARGRQTRRLHGDRVVARGRYRG
jgi:hypothetical protein